MLKVLKTLKWREWLYAAVAVGFIVLQVWLDLKMPDYMSQITQLAVMSDAANMPEIWKNGGLMLACALGSAVSSVAVGFFAARIAASVSFRLRSRVFDKVEGFSMEEINKFSTASLITRTTNDIMQVQMLISMGLQVVIKGAHPCGVGGLQNSDPQLAVVGRYGGCRSHYGGDDAVYPHRRVPEIPPRAEADG